MKLVKVRDIVIGCGMPKICVPVTGKNKEEILQKTEQAARKKPDLLEWRTDWFDDIFNEEALKDMLCEIRNIIGNIPLLYTFRTFKEGGRKEITVEQYEKTAGCAVDSGLIDLLDVEAFFDEELTLRMTAKCNESRVKIILSNHNFNMTPDKEELINILCRMHSYAPDIIKLAVMPRSINDAMTLLLAAEEMYRVHAEIPVIAISMSKEGLVSRLAGELFGNAVTFASAAGTSAPGQADIEDTRTVLKIVNRMLQ